MNVEDDILNEAAESVALDNPAQVVEAVEGEAERASTAFAAMTEAVESEFANLLESIEGEPKGITVVFVDNHGEPHPARPAFFAESWQGQERQIDETWLMELRDRADQTQKDASDAEAVMWLAADVFEQQPTQDTVKELRAAVRLFRQQTTRAVNALDMLMRAERALVVIWATANYHRRPFQRCGGEMPELVTLNMAELKA